ncbi:MAG TPA: lysylphosphatidylglycerol synthase domain-containing protein [Acidimicrobiales bacterium]|nr:lysylphosphatidylglycerol synthase domain-containing protein [Acidimicrobiales bacterium]
MAAGPTPPETETAEPPRVSRAVRAAQEALGRHPRDLARLALATAVVAVGFLSANRHGVDPLEAAIYRDISRLPAGLAPVSRYLSDAGSVAAIAVVAGVALFLRRLRAGTKLVLAGTGGWAAGHLLRVFAPMRDVATGRLVPGTNHQLVVHSVFPSDHMAVAAAMATVATPYLPRTLRPLILPLIALVALSLDFTGQQLALNIVTGAFIGWWVGTATHFAAGAPGRATSTRVVEQALHVAGMEPLKVVELRSRPFGPMHFEAQTRSGCCLAVEVVRRGQRRAGWSYRLRRLLASLEVDDEPGLSSPGHEVDHEAFVTLLADRAGVRTPPVMMAGDLGHGPALIVRQKVEGHRLSQLHAGDCHDAMLDEIWRQVSQLGEARIAHHDLRADNVLIDAKGEPWILDFAFARAGAADGPLAQDLAETLVSLASVVGIPRAVQSARRSLPDARLRSALTYLQPLALPARIRAQLGGQRSLLADLSTEVAKTVGEPRPSFRPRIRASTVLALAVGGGAVYLLLPQIGTVPRLLDAVRHADYWWLVAAFVAGAITFPMATASYIGAVKRPLPFWRTTLVQLASAFTSRLTPGGVGGMGLNMIYLQGISTPRSEAIGSIAVNQSAGVVVHASLFFISVAVIGASGVIGKVPLPTGWPVLAAVVGVLVGTGAFLGSPLGRRRVLKPTIRVGRDLFGVLRQPARALALFGGSAGVTLGNAAALAATLAAFDSHFSVVSVMAVYVGGAAIASPAPTPGNLGAVEAALVAGLTSIGIHSEPAVASVLSFRLLTFWLPILPGLAAFRYLQHRRRV